MDQKVISQCDQELVSWNIFSDNRFNGPWKLSDFSDQFPNLCLHNCRQIEGITLYSLLSNQKILEDPLSTFQLNIRQGDPLAILHSAKEWLARCTNISLHGLICSSSVLTSCEEYLRLCGFCQSDVDPSVWHPHLEKSSLHLSLIQNCLLALFNAEAYRKLYPELKDNTDIELMNHWLIQPNFREIAEEIEKTLRNKLDQDGLLALFNAEAYRKLYPELKDNTDIELMNHWLIQPNYLEISNNINNFVRCQLFQISELKDGDPALELLLNIFHFSFYRKIRPDLAHLSDKDLLSHYWQLGRHEGTDLSENYIHNYFLENIKKDYELKIKTLTGRVRELEKLLSSANAQIGAMQELIVSLKNTGVINE